MLWADVADIRGDTEVGSGAESNFGDLGMEGRGATAMSPGQLDIVTGRDLKDGVHEARLQASLTGGSPRSWEEGVSIMVWKTYLVVANCSAHFLPHRSSYSELLECAAHRPWTCR